MSTISNTTTTITNYTVLYLNAYNKNPHSMEYQLDNQETPDHSLLQSVLGMLQQH